MKKILLVVFTLLFVAVVIAQQPVLIRNINTALVTAAGALEVDGSAVTQPISAASLPLPAGASTSAKQPNFGTAGVPSADVLSVQGVAGGTPVPVTVSSVPSNQSVNVNQVAGASPDPCFGQQKTFFSISQTANTKVITGTSAKKIYFCSFNVVGADAENISVVEGTGSACGTSTITVPGFPAATAAAGWNFAANGGIAQGSGSGSIAGTSVNADDVCVFQSGSGRVAGGGSYVVQ